MARYVIPISASPSQTFDVALAGQTCTVSLDWRDGYGMFLSLMIGDSSICYGRICLDRVPIIRRVGSGLAGDLMFQDTQGVEDPRPDGLGSRWELIYDSGS